MGPTHILVIQMRAPVQVTEKAAQAITKDDPVINSTYSGNQRKSLLQTTVHSKLPNRATEKQQTQQPIN